MLLPCVLRRRDHGSVATAFVILGVLLGWRLYNAMGKRYFMKLGSQSAKG